ncbi:MAG: energy transducer TonB [Ignavibacteria bacterium]|nr:energy transducer TonB [Ignavibacteria bacterium]
MKYLLVILLVLISVKVYSQEDEFKVDQAPVALNLNEARKTMVYPPEAIASGIESKVIVKLLIGTDGSVIESKWEQGDSIFYRTVMKAVNMLQFTPALQDNKVVRCWVNLPFNFSLNKKNRSKDSERQEGK